MITGEYIIPVEYYFLRPVSENLAIAWAEIPEARDDPRSYILIDIAENREIARITYNFQYGHISNFHGEFAVISVGNPWGNYWLHGLIDSMGREVFPPIYSRIHHFSYALIQIDDKLEGRRRMQGRLVDNSTWEEVLPWHDFIGHVNDGLAVINTGGEWIYWREWIDEIINGYWGFIDETGQVLIPPMLPFERISTPSESIAAVQLNGKWGFIHIHGAIDLPSKP